MTVTEPATTEQTGTGPPVEQTGTEPIVTGPAVAVTADELAALAWVFDHDAVVTDGPTILDEVGEHRGAVAGSLLLSLAAKGVIDLDAPEGEPRLRPVPELPALPAQVTRPDRWIRFHRADEHGRRTRHLLAADDQWLVVDVIGELHVLATAAAADVGRLAAVALDVGGPEDRPDPPEPREPVPGPPAGGCRGDLWACGPAGGHLSRRWARWRDALTPTPHAAILVDLAAVVDGTAARDWFTVLASGPTWWLAQADPDAAVEDPSLLGDDAAPAVTEPIDGPVLLGLLDRWIPDERSTDEATDRGDQSL